MNMHAASTIAVPSFPAASSGMLLQSILESVPLGHYGVAAMLRLIAIEESTSVPTACVTCGEYSTLRVNPEFCAKHANTREKLMMLILHELHHIVLGHTRLFPRANLLDNFVFDAIINAMLCHAHPGPAYTALFRDMYDERDPLQCFLRPAAGWAPGAQAVTPLALLRLPELAAMHRKLYTVGSTYSELRQVLQEDARPNGLTVSMLLGNHEEALDSCLNDAPALQSLVESIVDQWPADDFLPGKSIGESLRSMRLLIKPTKRAVLRGILKKIGQAECGGSVRRRSIVHCKARSPCGAAARREIVLRALGGTPLLFTHQRAQRKMQSDGGLVHVYMDVSGSMDFVIAPLCAAICDCAESVHPKIHLFSTEICDVSMRELRAGAIQTTGGTALSCVAKHIKKNRIKRAVIVTDGFVGRIQGELAQAMQEATIGVALPAHHSSRADLAPYVNEWMVIPEGAL